MWAQTARDTFLSLENVQNHARGSREYITLVFFILARHGLKDEVQAVQGFLPAGSFNMSAFTSRLRQQCRPNAPESRSSMVSFARRHCPSGLRGIERGLVRCVLALTIILMYPAGAEGEDFSARLRETLHEISNDPDEAATDAMVVAVEGELPAGELSFERAEAVLEGIRRLRRAPEAYKHDTNLTYEREVVRYHVREFVQMPPIDPAVRQAARRQALSILDRLVDDALRLYPELRDDEARIRNALRQRFQHRESPFSRDLGSTITEEAAERLYDAIRQGLANSPVIDSAETRVADIQRVLAQMANSVAGALSAERLPRTAELEAAESALMAQQSDIYRYEDAAYERYRQKTEAEDRLVADVPSINELLDRSVSGLGEEGSNPAMVVGQRDQTERDVVERAQPNHSRSSSTVSRGVADAAPPRYWPWWVGLAFCIAAAGGIILRRRCAVAKHEM